MSLNKKNKQPPDWGLIGLTTFFIFVGLVMIADVSLVQAEVTFGDKFYFLKRQLVWVILGGSLALIVSRLNYHLWSKIAKITFLSGLGLLLFVFLPKIGVTAYGAKRWLNFGFINFQPVELMKLGVIFFFAKLADREEALPLWQELIFLAMPVGLILLQPDFGSAVLLISITAAIWFFGGKNLFGLSTLTVLSIVLGMILILSSPYRKQRLMGLLDPFYDPQGKSYHAYQLALTLGSGGIFGQGMGNSRQKFQYLPEATTDSIVALIAEEFGFLGITVFVCLFFLLVGRGISIARNAPDKFGQVLAGGITALIAFQGLINLGAVAIVLPLTGMPFPFVSYGGSSLITLLTAIGILISISRHTSSS